MSGRRIEIGVLVVCAVALGLAFFWKSDPTKPAPSSKPRASSALSALPSGAAIVISVDFARFKRSTFGELLTEPNRVLPGVGSLTEVCGFDPTAGVREFAAAVPQSASEDHDVGIAATGDFTVDSIIDCAQRVVSRRGGTPARTEIGSFVTLRDRANPGGEIAVKNGGPVLLGGGTYLREMIDTAEGKQPSLVADEAHQKLRQAVGTDAEVVASVVAKPGWLERWTGTELAKASPLAEVRAGALRVRLEPQLEAMLLLECPNQETCKRLGELGEELKKNLHETMEHWLGVDPIRTARVSLEKDEVRLTVTIDEILAKLALGRLFLGGDENRSTPSEAPSPPDSAKPNEVIRPPSERR